MAYARALLIGVKLKVNSRCGMYADAQTSPCGSGRYGARSGRGWKQPIVLRLDHRIALADACFQMLPVENPDAAAAVFDQSVRLQPARGFGDALASHG